MYFVTQNCITKNIYNCDILYFEHSFMSKLFFIRYVISVMRDRKSRFCDIPSFIKHWVRERKYCSCASTNERYSTVSDILSLKWRSQWNTLGGCNNPPHFQSSLPESILGGMNFGKFAPFLAFIGARRRRRQSTD